MRLRWIKRSATIAIGLLLLAHWSLAVGLADAIRALEPIPLLGVVTVSILFGWWLARTNVSSWPAAGIVLTLGLSAMLMYMGRLDALVLALVRQLAESPWRFGVPLQMPPAAGQLLAGLMTVIRRLVRWSIMLLHGNSQFDPIAAALFWGLLLWGVGVWAGWSVRRRSTPLQSLLPSGLLLGATLYYTHGNTYLMLPVLTSLLLLLALVGHSARERDWAARAVDYSRELRVDLGLTVVPIVTILIFLSIVLPACSVRQTVQAVQRIIAGGGNRVEPVARSLGFEQVGADDQLEEVRAPGLPRKHLIGAGPDLSEEFVMSIQVEGAPTDFRPYWRSFTYDRYTGHGWRTGETARTRYDANEPVRTAVPAGYRLVRQTVRGVEAFETGLFVAGSLVMVDRAYTAVQRSHEDLFGATTPTSRYQASSLVPTVSSTQLRAAGIPSGYPDWIEERYLALPDDVPARVIARAHDLTATEPTLYDRARAIETHLRTFPYTLDLPAPPLDRDIADYFLFELQKGYCDYYATTMVVLARAAGLPARLAIGYIGGIYDAETGQYVVSAAEAHSWVEIYFPGYGWITFEPTAGRPALERDTTPPPVTESTIETSTGSIQRIPSIPAIAAGLVGILSLGLVAWLLADEWRLRRQSPPTAIATMYSRMYTQTQRLDLPLRPGLTAYELVARLHRHIAALPMDGRWSELFVAAPHESRRLADLYVRAQYSPHPPGGADKEEALEIWRRLRNRLWLIWLWQRIRPQRLLKNE